MCQAAAQMKALLLEPPPTMEQVLQLVLEPLKEPSEEPPQMMPKPPEPSQAAQVPPWLNQAPTDPLQVVLQALPKPP
jgi:hypothetical protein